MRKTITLDTRNRESVEIHGTQGAPAINAGGVANSIGAPFTEGPSLPQYQ